MEPNQPQNYTSSPKAKTGAKDFFLNLGAIVSLYTLLYSLINLLFTIINTAYPKVVSGYNYFGSTSISWPVATLVIFFPIFILLMWLMEKHYANDADRQNSGIHKWLTYITLFIAGGVIAGDLITVLYYFIDGQELTTSFLLKILVLLVIALGVFMYYISDIRSKLTTKSRMIWRIVSAVVVVGSIIWGFSVLGSPRTQRLYKYDTQRVTDLQNINQNVISYFQRKGSLPSTILDLSGDNYYVLPTDPQLNQSYEYKLIGQSAKAYELCAEFNKASDDKTNSGSAPYYYPYQGISWEHPAGYYCFSLTIPLDMYPTMKTPL